MDNPVDRIKNFIANYERAQGVHPEEIYSMHSIPDGEPGQILVSDLRALLESADRITDALSLAHSYGQEDGAHHKMWVIDQMVRSLTGCPPEDRTTVISGKPYTFQELGESDEYRTFIAEHNAGEEGPETYSWDEGIAP